MERIEVLRKVLKGLNEGYFTFLCNAIFGISGKEATILFPELLEYKPADKKLHRAWWDYNVEGRMQRIKVVKELIKKLENGESTN